MSGHLARDLFESYRSPWAVFKEKAVLHLQGRGTSLTVVLAHFLGSRGARMQLLFMAAAAEQMQAALDHFEGEPFGPCDSEDVQRNKAHEVLEYLDEQGEKLFNELSKDYEVRRAADLGGVAVQEKEDDEA